MAEPTSPTTADAAPLYLPPTADSASSADSPTALPYALPVPDDDPVDLAAPADEPAVQVGGEATGESAIQERGATAEEVIVSLREELSVAQSTIAQQAARLLELVDLPAELSQLKDQHAFVSAAKEAVELQLQEEKKKRDIAEESVEMLRGQVEQARRGVMTLQKQEAERKRMSVVSGIGMGIAGGAGTGAWDEEVLSSEVQRERDRESKALRRSSMAARAHRRISSQSEPSDVYAALERQPVVSPNPVAGGPATSGRTSGGLRELRLASNPSTAANFSPGATSATANPSQVSYFDDAPSLAAVAKSIDSPTKSAALEEATRLRSELRAVRAKLEESEEARAASEDCLKALREFMASNDGELKDGESPSDLLRGISLPPLPTDRDADELAREAEAREAEAKRAQGWGFKLWANKPQPPVPAGGLSPNRSRATSSATTPNPQASPLPRASPLPKASPLPTPRDDVSITSAETPAEVPVAAGPAAGLSSFVSSWTKGVSPGVPPPAAGAGAGLQRSNSKKLSMGGFWSRRTQKEENDLPAVPLESEESADAEADAKTPVVSRAGESRGAGEGLELASPVVRPEDDKEREDWDRRKSHGTTVTDLEEYLGTGHDAVAAEEQEKEAELQVVGEVGGEAGEAKDETKRGGELDEVAL